MMNNFVTTELRLAVIILGGLPTNSFQLFPELKQNLAGHGFIDLRDLQTYLLTYLLTPWSRVLLEKLTSELCS
jgi:hypothetical protein